MDRILRETELVKKVAYLIRLAFLIYKRSSPDFHHFWRVVTAEEASAPKEVKACIAWYPRFSAERRAIQKAQEESIKMFSFRLSSIQKTLTELRDRLCCPPPNPVNEELEVLKQEIRDLKIANHKYELEIQATEARMNADKAILKETEQKLSFEMETQKEKARIMRNDLNFVLRQKQELESQICVQQDLVRQKSAECHSLRALLRDHDSGRFRHEG